MPDNTDRDAALAMFASLQQRAAAAGVRLRSPPSAPDTCCGRGCNGCVWEGWYEAVDYWREQALSRLAGQEPPAAAPA
jgi:hypothetical protein